MTNNNLRESVKTPSMIVSFEDPIINVFLHELIKGGAYKDAFELIFTKVYYNLDFFLDGSLPANTRISDSRDTRQSTPTEVQPTVALADEALNNKLDALTLAIGQIGKTQEDSNQTIKSMTKTIEDLLARNNELVNTLSEIQGTMQETKEGLGVLDKLETSGLNLSQVIAQNISLPEQVAKELPPKAEPKEPVKRSPAPNNQDNVSSGMAEAKSVFGGGGLFSKIKTSGDSDEGDNGDKIDMSAYIARMKMGQSDV